MGDSRLSGVISQRPRRRYEERWLERMVHGMYQSAVHEPVPKELLDILRRLPQSDPPTKRP